MPAPRPDHFPFTSIRFAAFVGFGILCCSGAAGRLGASPPLRLDREGAAHHALAHQPELRAATHELEKARARLRWAGRLGAPELDLSASTDRFGLRDGESVVAVAIERRFPLTDRLKRERDLSRVGVALAEMEIAEARRLLIAQAETAHLEALLSVEKERLLREMGESAEGFVEALERQAEEGSVSRLEVGQAKLDRQQLVTELRRQSAETARTLASLKSATGLPSDAELEVAGRLLPLAASDAHLAEAGAKAARERRPDWRLALLREDEARAELALADSNRWEDVAVRLFAEREAMVDAPGGLERNTFAGVGISIPLPLKRERLTDEPAAALGQAEERSRAAGLRIDNEIAAALRHRDDLLAVAREAAGEIVPLAEANLEAVAEAREEGQIEFFQLQRAREQVLSARRGAIEAAAEWQRTEISLRAAAALSPGIYPEETPAVGKP